MIKTIVIKVEGTDTHKVQALTGLLCDVTYDQLCEALDKLNNNKLKNLARGVHGRIYNRLI